MTAKHQTPEYRRNARTIKERAEAAWRAGGAPICWRCRQPIRKGAMDVGHLPGATGSSERELAPEHRHASKTCAGNRAAGGREGARKTNARHHPTQPKRNAQTWNV